MSPHPDNLIDALAAADMLEIDDLHAWQFRLDEAQLQGSDDAPLLSIECMDGRALRKWHFSLAQVQAARYEAADDCWMLDSAAGPHRLKCFAAISGDNDDAPDDAANDGE
jgi:hypothetical protein